MSHYWDVCCKDCPAQACVGDATLGFVRACIAARAEIAQAQKLVETMRDYDVEVKSPHGLIDPEFFLEHAGHTLVPLDEYDCFEDGTKPAWEQTG